MKRYIGILALGILALLALACAPATEPEAAPAPSAPQQTDVTAPQPAAQPEAPVAAPELAPTEGGTYKEVAGLRLFIPKGNQFGSFTIPPDPREPRYGGTFRRGVAGDPPSLDPYHTTGVYMVSNVTWIYERLLRLPAGPGTDIFQNERIPSLAESWEVADDFLTYTFHLRKGIKWHNVPPVNGREFDSGDPVATFNLYIEAGSVEKGFFNDVERVEAPDRYTVVYRMKNVFPGFLVLMSDDGGRGYILPREMTDPASTIRRTTVIGTGPYVQDSPYEYKVGMKYRRNPDYWRFDAKGNRLPYIDNVQQFAIFDGIARNTAFRTGKIDVGGTFSTPTDVKNLLKSNPTALIQETPANPIGTTGTTFRLDKAPWNDVRVRRAMVLAIDFDTWGQTVYEVPQAHIQTQFAGGWYGLKDHTIKTVSEVCQCPWYTYDPQRAKALLAEAGYPNGLSNVMVEFYAYGNQVAPTYELYAAYWKEIGVNVKLNSMDYTVIRRLADLGQWTDITNSYLCCPGPTTAEEMIKSLVPGHAQNGLRGHLNDPVLTGMVEEYLASYRDEAKQLGLLRQMHARFLDQAYGFPWATSPSFIVFTPRLRNYQPTISTRAASDQAHVLMYTWIDDEWAFGK